VTIDLFKLSHSKPLRTIVYVDGFNFYYGALKGSAYKWLDLDAFCRLLLPKNEVIGIRYFTARISDRPNNPGSRIRQQTYLRALATVPSITVHFGHYLSHPVRLPQATPDGDLLLKDGKPQFTCVLKAEEKGSDVNLASHLVHDAHRGMFEAAVVISNDSDLATPISIVREDLGLVVGVANPHAENPRSRQSVQLRRVASFLKPVRRSALARCQLPRELQDGSGRFHKPPEW
jgi:NYN domain